MAQLNPNFEIDFNDINSYEQIQLINDTQLAKENLLMHKAYKEPAEDEIIRNQFSSFTFVDFCPKLFHHHTSNSQTCAPPSRGSSRAGEASNTSDSHVGKSSSMLRQQNYELETFSDLFDRINIWLKLNKDWRVVSMETLVFDCTSQFNHLKSSIHSSYLPKNMRGLRLYLSPSKSRFSGAQKIGCINVIPRKISGRYPTAASNSENNDDEELQYETLDQILTRLNELLLTRPIEGRILSVETITLPIVNGYVNTETNYLMDSRLNLLNARIYTHATATATATATTTTNSCPTQQPSTSTASIVTQQPLTATSGRVHSSQGLIDILRVYYEFGPVVCGLVNLIDFLPHFHRHQQEELPPEASELVGVDLSESLTRLVRRSLRWFEEERKRVLAQHLGDAQTETLDEPEVASTKRRTSKRRAQNVNLKVCNLQVHRKILLKSQLLKLNASNALDLIQTRQMFHQQPRDPIHCHECSLSSSSHQPLDWCQHLNELNEPFEVKFVRLAYVVPVYDKYATSRLVSMLPPPRSRPIESDKRAGSSSSSSSSSLSSASSSLVLRRAKDQIEELIEGAASSPSVESISQPEVAISQETSGTPGSSRSSSSSSSSSSSGSSSSRSESTSTSTSDSDEDEGVPLSSASGGEQLIREATLSIVHDTNERQRANELAHQLSCDELQSAGASSSSHLIGQLTYRLFAPCQLVNSSSCFAINPVNSSSPLARRGSVNLSGGSGGNLSSENATPSTLLLSAVAGTSGHQAGVAGNLAAGLSESSASINQHVTGGSSSSSSSHQVISFGAFFPALSHDLIMPTSLAGTSSGGGAGNAASSSGNPMTSGGAHFTTNEFEPVEAIKRRMEIYVTTNSMKVLAGETLIVQLSDQLSCLSTAIERTIVKASFQMARPASTWVSVYVLYAAVDEPHLPQQLLEQQRIRERLTLISEESAVEQNDDDDGGGGGDDNDADQPVNGREAEVEQVNAVENNMVPVFNDDFNQATTSEPTKQEATSGRDQVAPRVGPASRVSLNEQQDGSIRVQLERVLECGSREEEPEVGLHSSNMYNSAYDRTVALPTRPDNHLNDYLEPVDFNLNPQQLAADGLWYEGDEVNEQCASGEPDGVTASAHGLISLTSVSVRAAQRQMRLRKSRAEHSKYLKSSPLKSKSKGKSKRHSEESQCSMM